MYKEVDAGKIFLPHFMYSHHHPDILKLKRFLPEDELYHDVARTVWILDSVYCVDWLMGPNSFLKHNLFIIEGLLK